LDSLRLFFHSDIVTISFVGRVNISSILFFEKYLESILLKRLKIAKERLILISEVLRLKTIQNLLVNLHEIKIRILHNQY